MPIRTRLPAGIAEATYVELVRSALGTLFAASVMGILFVLVSSHVVSRTDDAGLHCLSLIGVALSVLRIAVLLPLSTASRLERTDARQALRAERLLQPHISPSRP